MYPNEFQKSVYVVSRAKIYLKLCLYRMVGNSECQFKRQGTNPVKCYSTSSKQVKNVVITVKSKIKINTLLITDSL